MTSEDADKAARLANALGEKYIEKQVAQKVNQTLVARNILQQRVRELRRIWSAWRGVSTYSSRILCPSTSRRGPPDLVTLRDE